MEKGKVRLVTRADDCGSSHSANLGIQDALEGGILKNVSVMAPCDFVEEAADLFAGRKEICFGLHATLNAEWDAFRWRPVLPASRVPTLVDETGAFTPSPEELKSKGPDTEEILAELRAQLEKLRGLGFTITYLDTHMVPEYALPGLERRLASWAEHERLLYWAHYCRSLAVAPSSGDLIGEMVARLEAAEPGQYLYLGHPAVDSAESRRMGNRLYSGETIARRRDLDRKLFTDPAILRIVAERRVEPLRYDQAEKITERLPPSQDWLSRL